MKTFKLVRNKDISGVSGTGVVAMGALFPSGRCVIEWVGNVKSIEILPTLDDLISIHGHQGCTEVIFD